MALDNILELIKVGVVWTAKRVQNGHEREIVGEEESIYYLEGRICVKKRWLNRLVIP